MKASPEGSAERGLWPSEKQRPIPRKKEDRGEGEGGNTPTQSGLLRRGADAGGRRSRGGMPTWSSRAEEQDDKQQDDLWKMKVIFGGCWKMSLADKTPWISEMRPSQLTTLNHATPRSPQPLQSRSHLGPGERPQPTKRGGGNNRCESAWTEQRRRHHCQAGNAHCHNKCHTYWNAQKWYKWVLPRILHRIQEKYIVIMHWTRRLNNFL